MGKVKTCGACGNRDISISYYRVPKERKIRKLWLANSGVDPSINVSDDTRICALHFAEDAFTERSQRSDANVSSRRLTKGAVPSIVVQGSGNHPKRERVHDCCFICGWRKNTENSANLSFFGFPRDINKRIEWLKILGRENTSHSDVLNNRLCSLHFNKADIINPNSKRPTLRIGCVPLKSKTSEEIVHNIDTDQTSTNPVVQNESDTSDEINEATGNDFTSDDVSIPDSTPCEMICGQEPNLSPTVDENRSLGPVTVTPTKNGQSVADGVFAFLANKPASNSLNSIVTPTANRCRFKKPSYIGDIRTPHLATPRRAKSCFNMTKAVITKQRKTINCLRRKLRIARAKIKSMQDLIQHLRSQLYISENAADHFMADIASVID